MPVGHVRYSNRMLKVITARRNVTCAYKTRAEIIGMYGGDTATADQICASKRSAGQWRGVLG